ncbi:MAG: hypothetical protein L0Y44_15810 [Phycisphaerales bacterium]|nr:hypothetical protein [Phycisphaerales bacterium]MCI0632109.1 hypothetical protein [Phycisphaerales bacterium]MCI0676802.1 hypothetical protein [Phycisphaerales bacterium]
MGKKLGGIIFALALMAFGGHMTYDPAKYDMTDYEASGRRAIYKKALAAVVNTLGPRTTGIVLLCGGGLMLVVTVRGRDDHEI